MQSLVECVHMKLKINESKNVTYITFENKYRPRCWSFVIYYTVENKWKRKIDLFTHNVWSKEHEHKLKIHSYHMCIKQPYIAYSDEAVDEFVIYLPDIISFFLAFQVHVSIARKYVWCAQYHSIYGSTMRDGQNITSSETDRPIGRSKACKKRKKKIISSDKWFFFSCNNSCKTNSMKMNNQY